MFLLVLSYLVVWAVLIGLLWAGTAWLQDYIYSEPAADLYWRAPAAGSALLLWIAFWSYLDYRSVGKYTALFDFGATETKKFDEIWVMRDNKKVHYKLSATAKSNIPGRVEFREVDPPYRVWSRSDAVIIKENGEDVRFEAERDANKHYKIERGKELLYRDDRGRVMSEGTMGRIYVFRWGVFITYAFLNLFFFAIWFAALWLLLRFQWSHALGLAAILWTTMVLLIVPMMLTKVEAAARSRAAPPADAKKQAQAPATPVRYKMCMMSPSLTT